MEPTGGRVGLVRRQLVIDLEGLDLGTAAEFESAVASILARASGPEADVQAVLGWTVPLAREFVEGLQRRGRHTQARTLAFQAHNDGYISRDIVFRLAGYAPERRLNGYTKPS